MIIFGEGTATLSREIPLTKKNCYFFLFKTMIDKGLGLTFLPALPNTPPQVPQEAFRGVVRKYN